MKPRFTLSQLTITVFLFALLFSCSKENSQSVTPQQQAQASLVSGQSDSQAEIIFNGIFDDAMGVNNYVGMGGTGIFGRGASINGYTGIDSLPTCATVTITHTNATSFFPVQVLIDFGTTGCTRPADGHTRRGKIIIVYTNRLLVPGAVATTTFDGFYIDSIKVEGTHTITNTSPTATNILARQFTADVINAKLSTLDGNYINWNSHKIITQTQGLTTPSYPMDDVFQVEGSANGLSKNGNMLVAWQSTVIKPLVKEFQCRWITEGTVKIVRASSNTAASWIGYLDYGTGNCDNLATITINGVVYQITLH